MPLVPYRCAPCGIELEELFFRSESPEEALPCPGCSGLAPRVHVSKFSFTGADQGYLDSMSRAHFTDAELRAGKMFEKSLEEKELLTSLQNLIYNQSTIGLTIKLVSGRR